MTPEQFKQWRLAQSGESRQGKTHRGWSQADVARFFGLSLRTVQSWESGRPVPQRIVKMITEIEKAKRLEI